ncbi:MAG: integrase core domain-containing protein [Candidatus Thermoplasmatota archaeon]|nr:integrase core domain-containing protein [Candidatus Thermoplasmatota archaeon]
MNVLTIALEYIKKHTPEDNGDIESFHDSIKTDYTLSFEFKDYSEASVAIEKAFKDYNEYRPHSYIDYLPPREFRRRFLEDQSFEEKYMKKLEAKLNEK